MNVDINKKRTIRGLCHPVVAGVLLATVLAGPAVRGEEPSSPLPDLTPLVPGAMRLLRAGGAWYARTPATARMCWGGLAACAGLGLVVLTERLLRLRRRRIIPADFTARFLDRLHEGKLDGGKALDYCEMNPSPAARVALAAVRRWGRPSLDLERAVSLAYRVEADRLRRNVGTLRRVATIAPLLGTLGTLTAAERLLEAVPASAGGGAWGPGAAAALSFLTAGVAIATLAMVAYDALSVRIERLSGALDRLGAETIDAIAMAAPARPPALLANPGTVRAHGPHAELRTTGRVGDGLGS